MNNTNAGAGIPILDDTKTLDNVWCKDLWTISIYLGKDIRFFSQDLLEIEGYKVKCTVWVYKWKFQSRELQGKW